MAVNHSVAPIAREGFGYVYQLHGFSSQSKKSTHLGSSVVTPKPVLPHFGEVSPILYTVQTDASG